MVLASALTPGEPGVPTILVIDDSEDSRISLAAVLETQGFAVLEAGDGESGLQLARSRSPDLVIQDLILPDMSGLELCAQLRSLPGGSRRPILGLSGVCTGGGSQASELVGFDEFLAKPIPPEVLLPKVQHWLSPASEAGRIRRLECDLDRLGQLNRELVRRFEIRTAAMSALEGASADNLAASLASCLKVCGAPSGAILSLDPDGRFALASAHGFAKAPPRLLEARFGLDEHLKVLVEGNPPIRLDARSPRVGSQVSATGHQELVLSRLGAGSRCQGVLVVGTDQPDDDLPFLAHAIGLQLGQVLALRQAQQSLAESEARAATLMEKANSGIVVADLEGRTLQANARAEEILGRSRAELKGMRLIELIDPETVPLEEARFQDLLRTGSARSSGVILVRPSGEKVVADFSLSLVDVGTRRLILAMFLDVTRERALEAELRQSQRLDAFGRLAGGVAHDFNNLVGVILGYADLALDRLDPRDPLHREISTIRNAGDKAAALTRQLLAFSRKQVLSPRPVDLNGLVRGVERMLGRVLGEDIRLDCLLDPEPLRAQVDPTQIEQVLINLALNARDAMPRGGTLLIASGRGNLGPDRVRDGVAPGVFAWIEVQDDGTGIPREILGRIWEPYFTTKAPGKGNGLGLPTSYGIVRQLGGFFEVESQPGKGSTFRFHLPLAPTGAASAPPPTVFREIRGQATILVVEDDAELRHLMAKNLQRFGYETVPAAGPLAAIAAFEREPGRFDLVLTDVVMPDLNGPELVTRLRALRPGLPVLYMSGFLEHQILEQGGDELCESLIAKPFGARDLAERIRATLDRARSSPP